MRAKQRAVFIGLAFMLVLPVFLTGCVAFPDAGESRGVKLSDAMQASASGDQRDLGGRSSQETHSGTGGQASVDVGSLFAGGRDPAVSYDKTEYYWQAMADVSYSLPINSDFESITHFTLTPVSMEDERNCLGLYVGGAIVQLKAGSLPESAVDRTWMLETGLTYRRYLNSSRTALSPYLTTSLGFTMLNWSYHSQVTAGGDTFQSDSLYGAEGSLAIGISTRRDYRVSFFGEAGIGGTAFSDTTVNGFDNDVFHDFGFLIFKAGLSFKF